MGYTENDGMVRVDFFKPSGKWYITLSVDLSEFYDEPSIHEAFAKALRKHFSDLGHPDMLSDMDAVCPEPFHKHGHPVIIKAGGWLDTKERWGP